MSKSPSRDSMSELPSSELNVLVTAIRGLQQSVEASTSQVARLADAIERFLGTGEEQASSARLPRSPAPRIVSLPVRRQSINWVVGPAENTTWAYGNNARRLATRLPAYDHHISADTECDIAVYFDALVAANHPVKAGKSVLRLGGSRPLDRLFGKDDGALATALAAFDAVVALSAALYLRAARLHPNVYFIPNALDLDTWHAVRPEASRPFTAGFAASLSTKDEATMKGHDIAVEAARSRNVRLLAVSRGERQIPHERMHADFYAKIDVLLHPVAAGREGTSNVIMEAMACGVPVITTTDAGFHGEFLVDGRTALLRPRSAAAFADAITTLTRSPELRQTLAEEARRFAERQHSLDDAIARYDAVFRSLSATSSAVPARRKVAFVPFWEPTENFGSSRLRAQYPAAYLTKRGQLEVVVGYAADADVVIIVQMCTDEVMSQLLNNTGQFVIYDVCDKYYEKPRLFKHLASPVDSLSRFHQLVERADLLLAPSEELKLELASRVPTKAVKYVPEPVDYEATGCAARETSERVVLWFGNPDRGNFDEVRGMLEHLRQRHGFRPLIVSRKSYFRGQPSFEACVVEWSPSAMKQAFADAALCIVGYAPDEQTKSANRFVAAMMHGVPTLVRGSPACSDILERSGHRFAQLTDVRSLDQAIAKLQNREYRARFVAEVQRQIVEVHGEAAVTRNYVELLAEHTIDCSASCASPRKLAFVSHNLELGDGAPLSQYELVCGLRERGIEPYVFSPIGGPVAELYQAAGIHVETFEAEGHDGVETINHKYSAVRQRFCEFLRENAIEAVVCNTVKAAPYVDFAHLEDLPGQLIVRESYDAAERFSFFQGEAKLSAIRGVTHAEQVVFVAETSRKVWSDMPFKGLVRVIRNGISRERFAQAAQLSKRDARKRLGWPPEDVVAICVGRVTKRKGQQQLLRAFAELPPLVSNAARLVIIGVGESRTAAELRAELARLPGPLQTRVTLVPPVHDLGPYYAAADVSLLNSRSEAYPRSVLESLLWGLPVISTPVHGVQEQIRPGKDGFLYEQDDMAAWSSHFSLLVTDEGLRSAMSKSASRSFARLTSYPEMVLAYRALLSRLACRPTAVAGRGVQH